MCPIRNYPKHEPTQDKMLEIPQPAIGGINLKDLEFEQDVSQSPNMLNVMYRNGSFSKRYGQGIYASFEDDVYSAIQFDGSVFVHSGNTIYVDGTNAMGTHTVSAVDVRYTIPETSGVFIVFQQKLYYMVSKVENDDLVEGSGFWEYKKVGNNYVFVPMDAYIPDLVINCHPDGQGGDQLEQTNVIGNKFRLIYNGTGDTADYVFGTYDPDDIIRLKDENDNIIPPEIIVYGHNDDQPLPYDDTLTVANSFKVVLDDQDPKNNKVVFSFQPEDGDLNVEMVFQMKESVQEKALIETLSCKYYDTYGGQYNSRVFLAGDGQSRYYWSASYDITYWPSLNYAKLGNTEDDITGLGRQYNALIAFKPRETFQIVSVYETTFSDLVDEIDKESFRASLVNPIIGCDAPHSLQVINNLLTWFSSTVGICTLVSTNLADERNIRVLSRNIEKTNNFGVEGILDIDENPLNVQSADFDKKYFLCFPTSGKCFAWDYEISPYFYSSANGETPPAKLTWFLFDHFYVKQFVKNGKDLLYLCDYEGPATVKFLNKDRLPTQLSGWGVNPIEEPVSVSFFCYNYVYTFNIMEGKGTFLANYPTTLKDGHQYYLGIKARGDVDFSFGDIEFTSSAEYERKTAIVDSSYVFGLTMGVGTVEMNGYFLLDLTESFHGNIPKKEILDTLITKVNYNYLTTVNYTLSLKNKLAMLNYSFDDLDFNNTGANAIHSYYMTPFMQFGAVEWLKTVRNLYVQCRGDTNTKINVSYYTDETAKVDDEQEPIMTGGGGSLWQNFSWDSFHWFINVWGNTFRRKCNLKKIQMVSMRFENNELNRDMSITHIGMQYQILRNVR